MNASKDEALDPKMSPDASPGEKNKTGVRRVNNMPLLLLGGVIATFVAVMMYVAAGKSAQQNAPAESEAIAVAGNTSALAREIAGQEVSGMVAPAIPEKIVAPYPPENKPAEGATAAANGPLLEVVRPDNLNLPPTPPSGQLVSPSGGSYAQGAGKDDLERLRNSKLQMFEEAIKSKPAVQVFKGKDSPGRSSDPRDQLAMVRSQLASANAASGDPTAIYQAKLAQIKEQLGEAGIGGANSGSNSINNKATAGDPYNQFGATGAIDRWRHDMKLEAPRSPYELRAGFVIPGLLISGINSDLPGQIMAQVSQNVYDTATGKYVLIPQGTRMVGQYSSSVAYGQNRVLVAWQRLIFPDGKALDIGSMQGADQGGYAGYKDKVNNHFMRVFGSAFLMSGIVAGVSLSQDQESGSDSGTDRQRASDAMSEALGQQLGQAMTQMLMKNLNIAPTIEIRTGYRFNVIVNKDLTFNKPYQSFDY
jgi:type IV secretion system protein TrbI